MIRSESIIRITLVTAISVVSVLAPVLAPGLFTTDFSSYTQKIDSDTGIQMLPVDGGTFTMGTTPADPHHREDEGPAHEVRISPFWMGAYEITWEQYERFMLSEEFEEISEPFGAEQADAVTRPSRTTIDPSHGLGRGDNPAVSMTQYAALAFTRWLTLKTGHFYRLPTEAEWEYACRAGTDSSYHFGDDPAELDEYGWHFGNSDYGYHETGIKRPNQWGLYDMHGNAAEWTLDQYDPDFYSKDTAAPVSDPWSVPTDIEPRTVRGGSWNHDPDQLRCASRIASDRDRWKRDDPQIPKSLWWNTNSPFVGFRIVRPAEQPSVGEMEAFWEKNLDQFYYE
ncbi:MAG: SUMF1/EgtB/PvdO family nonheme iron enzyme [Balneolaceae bacterium]